MPLAGYAIELQPMRVLNLCDEAVRSALGVTLAQLTADDWKGATDRGSESLCQALGRAAKDAGYEALHVPSAEATIPGEYNVVIIVENCVPNHWKVLHEEALP